MAHPLTISVILPVFNGEKFLEVQLLSIIHQLNELDEVIIVNDGSTDNSKNILNKFRSKYPSIKLFHNLNNLGLRKTVNKSLKLASKDIIVFADQDDEWLPRRIEAIRDLHLSTDCVIVDAYVCNQNLEINLPSYMTLINFSLKPIKMFLRCRVLGCCMSFKRKTIVGINVPFGCWHDHFIIMSFIFRKLKIHVVREQLIKFRRHEKTLSKAGATRKNLFKIPNILVNRLILLIGLLYTHVKPKMLLGRF